MDLLASIAYCRTLLPTDADPAHAAALDEIERWLGCCWRRRRQRVGVS